MTSVYLQALVFTIVIETAVIAALFPGQRRSLALTCVGATTVTHLAMHLLLPIWLGRGPVWLVTGEAMALVLEAVAYVGVSRPRDAPRAVLASALANAASFGGWLLVRALASSLSV